MSILNINKILAKIPAGATAVVDFSDTRLVGITVLEDLYDFQKLHENTGGTLTIRGLENHSSSSSGALGAKINLDYN